MREGRFLPDRYVEGECPHCGSPDARGDQCDNCGKLLEPTELINPRSKASGDTDLELREPEHYFLDLAKLSDELADYLSHDKDHWRPNVINFARNIPFHTVIWPAELLALGRLYCQDCETDLNLSYDVPANEYLN